jgi:hypothetical protein
MTIKRTNKKWEMNTEESGEGDEGAKKIKEKKIEGEGFKIRKKSLAVEFQRTFRPVYNNSSGLVSD